jgi:hypothetical protein
VRRERALTSGFEFNEIYGEVNLSEFFAIEAQT